MTRGPARAQEHPAPTWERWGSAALIAVTGAAIVPRLLLLRFDGLIYPDEVHQSLEQAHRLAFGSGLIPWEFSVGARHWALAGILAGVMRVGDWIGVSPEMAARLVLALSSGATAWAAARLAKAVGASVKSQLIAAATWATLTLAVLFGPRGLSDSAATLPLVLGLAWALEPRATRIRLASAAGLLVLATTFRLQVGLFAVGAVVTWVARRDVPRALWLGGSLAGGALAAGAVDLVTWGSWFHSAREYLSFNLLEGRSAEFGVAPKSYYLRHLWASLGLALPIVAGLSVLAARRATAVLLTAVAFVVLHHLVPHKELRFLFPVLPVVVALAGVGMGEVASPLAARLAGATLVGALLVQPGLSQLTFRRLGVFDADIDEPAYDAAGSENRLLAEAGRRASVCGVEVKTRQLGYVGATAWLHRDIPLFGTEKPPANPRSVNAVITTLSEAPGQLLAFDGKLGLFLLRETCEAAPDFDRRLYGTGSPPTAR